jgi:hypothetical protein
MSNGEEAAVAQHTARVGTTVPGAFAATWPLVGLRFDDRGFELACGVLIGRLLASSFPRACPWGDVSSVRRITALNRKRNTGDVVG